jgi:hypothetical protein
LFPIVPSSTVSYLENFSDLSGILFSAKTDYTQGAGPSGLVVADLNGDGKPDIGTANVFDGTVSLFRNNSTTAAVNFDSKVDYYVGNGPMRDLGTGYK